MVTSNVPGPVVQRRAQVSGRPRNFPSVDPGGRCRNQARTIPALLPILPFEAEAVVGASARFWRVPKRSRAHNLSPQARRSGPTPLRGRRLDFPALPARRRKSSSALAYMGRVDALETASRTRRLTASRVEGARYGTSCSFGLHQDDPGGGRFLGLEGPVDAAGGMLGSAWSKASVWLSK